MCLLAEERCSARQHRREPWNLELVSREQESVVYPSAKVKRNAVLCCYDLCDNICSGYFAVKLKSGRLYESESGPIGRD